MRRPRHPRRLGAPPAARRCRPASWPPSRSSRRSPRCPPRGRRHWRGGAASRSRPSRRARPSCCSRRSCCSPRRPWAARLSSRLRRSARRWAWRGTSPGPRVDGRPRARADPRPLSPGAPRCASSGEIRRVARDGPVPRRDARPAGAARALAPRARGVLVGAVTAVPRSPARAAARSGRGRASGCALRPLRDRRARADPDVPARLERAGRPRRRVLHLPPARELYASFVVVALHAAGGAAFSGRVRAVLRQGHRPGGRAPGARRGVVWLGDATARVARGVSGRALAARARRRARRDRLGRARAPASLRRAARGGAAARARVLRGGLLERGGARVCARPRPEARSSPPRPGDGAVRRGARAAHRVRPLGGGPLSAAFLALRIAEPGAGTLAELRAMARTALAPSNAPRDRSMHPSRRASRSGVARSTASTRRCPPRSRPRARRRASRGGTSARARRR